MLRDQRGDERRVEGVDCDEPVDPGGIEVRGSKGRVEGLRELGNEVPMRKVPAVMSKPRRDTM